MEPQSQPDRRSFLKNGLIVTATTLTGIASLNSCANQTGSEGQEVSPAEDLMQEHGLLNRILLIYDNCRVKLIDNVNFPLVALSSAAQVIRQFVEDYHEKQEEEYLFPRFEKANQLMDLVTVLRQQHQAGRRLTDRIMLLSRSQTGTENEKQQLIQDLTSFNTMYRPHEAREDTVLFPAFRKIVSRHEYDSLGEQFETNEKQHFGQDGFAAMVNKVTQIERSLGIYDLSQFTPQV